MAFKLKIAKSNLYNDKIAKSLLDDLGVKNIMEVPKLKKIVLNMGMGDARDNKNAFKQAIEELTAISGQKPIVKKSKKAISNFKIREGDPVGIMVTLRKKRMYEFLERFIAIVSPRISDFRGFSPKGFDGRGNYNFGIDEQVVFPEIDYDKVDKIKGLDISICTNAKTDKEALELLKGFNMPFNDKS